MLAREISISVKACITIHINVKHLGVIKYSQIQRRWSYGMEE